MLLNDSSFTSDTPLPSLRIFAFKDISAFILETIQKDHVFNLEITYVKNADEAHEALRQHQADIVFMSYDDTLSMALENKYNDIVAFMPIHGGMLDLCGNFDLTANNNRVGIDTNTGYARALRKYLRNYFANAQDYQQLVFVMAGATNIRYEKLRENQIDVTLLNPPFSYRPDVHPISPLTLNQIIPYYQGVVANLNKSWWDKVEHQQSLRKFIKIYQKIITYMQENREETISKLTEFYHLTQPVSSAIYSRLWMADGLNTKIEFNEQALAETEVIFAHDTSINVPPLRTWILPFSDETL